MLNELLLKFARWLDTFQWSTDLHESLYMYGWVETTHVLTLILFLGMLLVIDLRLLGTAFTEVPVSTIVDRLDKPMMIGFVVMVISGALLFFAIPVRSTQSIWFRIKVVLLISAGINALLIRNMTRSSNMSWDSDAVPPRRIRIGAGLSMALWLSVIGVGRSMAYDWWDCKKDLSYFMYWVSGCVDEMAAFE